MCRMGYETDFRCSQSSATEHISKLFLWPILFNNFCSSVKTPVSAGFAKLFGRFLYVILIKAKSEIFFVWHKYEALFYFYQGR